MDAAVFAAKVSGDGKWDHHQDLVNQNNGFVHAVNTAVVAFQAAERRAANAIEALFGGQQWHTAKDGNSKDPNAYGYDSIPDNAKTPWGADVQKKDGCVKSALKDTGHFFAGVGSAAWGMVKGLGNLVGFGGWQAFKSSWEGMAFLATIIIPGGSAVGMAIWGPKGYTQRMAAMGKGLLDWNEWKSDPAKAAGASLFNVGTLFIPFADGASAAGDAAKGAELAGDAGRAGKLARAGELAKSGLQTFSKLTDPFHYLGKLPRVLDLANEFKFKFPEMVGFGGKGGSGLDHAMQGWGSHDHTPEPVGVGAGHSGGHDSGTAGHDGAGTGAHSSGSGHDSAGSHSTGSGHDGGGTHPTSGGHDGTGTHPTSGGHDGTGGHDGAGHHPDGSGEHPKEYTDANGKQHYQGDPKGTSRDANGGLHDAQGHWLHDPHAPVHHAGDTALADKGATVEHTVSPSLHHDYAHQVEARTKLATEHTSALRTRNELAHELHVDAKNLSGSKLKNTIDNLKEHASPADLDKIDRLQAAARHERQLSAQLNRASEKLGMTAGQDVIKSHDGEVIVGGGAESGRAHELDIVGVGKDGKTLTVVEAKGGDSAHLGERTTADGVRAQQGSTAYLNDLIHRDPRLAQYLHEHPQFARDVADGKVKIDYQLVVGRGSGSVRVTDFNLNPNDLHLEDLAPGTIPTTR